jgi:hypothetical protein
VSDFDEVLERLVTDPAFQAALRADPQAALHGYQLTADEWQLLQTQVDLAAGDEHAVEARVSKSGLFGLVGPVVSALGFVEPPTGSPSPAVPPEPGAGPGNFGVAQVGAVSGVGKVEAVSGVGHVEAGSGVGHVHPGDLGQAPPAVDYHTRVDADGDGRWDKFQAVERGDGGVDILVDRNRDGVVDFVGHDYDRDGLVDDADYDTDFDGAMDTRMSDLDGDGWLDTREAYPQSGQSGVGIVSPGQQGVGVVPPAQE